MEHDPPLARRRAFARNSAGLEGQSALGLFHIVINLLIAGSFWLLAAAWRVLYEAQGTGELALDGPYARIRHPQYAGFVLIMFGF